MAGAADEDEVSGVVNLTVVRRNNAPIRGGRRVGQRVTRSCLRPRLSFEMRFSTERRIPDGMRLFAKLGNDAKIDTPKRSGQKFMKSPPSRPTPRRRTARRTGRV